MRKKLDKPTEFYLKGYRGSYNLNIFTLEELSALVTLDQVTPEQMVRFANEFLDNGSFAEEFADIYDLQSQHHTYIKSKFRQYLTSQNAPNHNRFSAADFLLRETLNMIVSKEIDAERGASYIQYDLYEDLLETKFPEGKYLGSNYGLEKIFAWVREIWDCRDGSTALSYPDLPRPAAEQKYLDRIIQEAGKWLEQYPPNHIFKYELKPRQ